mmetsp:Transcript_11816/g.18147  ORF Transcript_11816/g.18147 Transcript_11816/m.18147 type:complete len:216 (-) Transcript_11816:122-769(-)
MIPPFRIVAIVAVFRFADAFFSPLHHHARRQIKFFHPSACKSSMQPIDELADDDLVALPFDGYLTTISSSSSSSHDEDEANLKLRLCVIRNQQYIYPLIRHEDDVETDLFLDPRCIEKQICLKDILQWWNGSTINESNNNDGKVMAELQYYGVGWYGQRPVPSLGGGPGYGAEADEVWSIDEDVLEQLLSEDGVDLPVIDVGMAHGEKARGGALF